MVSTTGEADRPLCSHSPVCDTIRRFLVILRQPTPSWIWHEYSTACLQGITWTPVSHVGEIGLAQASRSLRAAGTPAPRPFAHKHTCTILGQLPWPIHCFRRRLNTYRSTFFFPYSNLVRILNPFIHPLTIGAFHSVRPPVSRPRDTGPDSILPDVTHPGFAFFSSRSCSCRRPAAEPFLARSRQKRLAPTLPVGGVRAAEAPIQECINPVAPLRRPVTSDRFPNCSSSPFYSRNDALCS